MQLNYGTVLLDVVDAKSSCHLAAGELPWELSLRPSLLQQKLSTDSRSPQTLDHFLKKKRIEHFTYLCLTSRTKQHSADVIPALFTPTDAVISSLPLPQYLSGEMLLVRFDANSATEVKALVLVLSFVVTATSEFNSAVCFSTARFA